MLKIVEQYRGLRRENYVLFFCKLIDHAGSMIGPMLTLILSEKLGMDATEIAIYFLILTAFSIPVNLYGGRLCDRINKKVLINICDIATSVIYIVCGILGLSRLTLALYLVGSLLQSAESPAYDSLTADFTDAGDRDRAYSLSYLGMNIGMVLAPAIGGFMMKRHVGLMFILSGVFQLISVIFFDIFISDTKAVRDEKNSYESATDQKNILQVLRGNRVLIPFMLTLAFSMLFYHSFEYLMPLSLSSAHGENGSVIFGSLSSVNCVAVLVFTAPLTAIFIKRHAVDRMIWGNLFEILGMALFVLSLGLIPLYFVAMTIFTLGEILNTITTGPYLTKRIPLNFRGRIMALSGVLSKLVIAFGKLGVGKIYDNYGNGGAWIVMFAVGGIATLCYFAVRYADRKVYPDLYSKDGTDL